MKVTAIILVSLAVAALTAELTPPPLPNMAPASIPISEILKHRGEQNVPQTPGIEKRFGKGSDEDDEGWSSPPIVIPIVQVIPIRAGWGGGWSTGYAAPSYGSGYGGGYGR